LKATAAASAQVSKFCFHRAIPGIKLSHRVHSNFFFAFTCIHIQRGAKGLPLALYVRVVFRATDVTDNVGLAHCLGLTTSTIF